MSSAPNLEDLNLTNDEVKRLGEAIKDENFRKMLIEYAEEIADPDNRRRYEEEITQMEKERGMDISFINPEPGYVIKTSVNGVTKTFINICKSDKIGKPISQHQELKTGQKGFQWSIPHSFSACRNDKDNKGSSCFVYDVVFHPDTYRMAETNKRFKQLVNDTAIDGIEKQFNVKLDRNNLKFPKLTFKGKPTATVIRRKLDNPVNASCNDDILSQMPYPYDNKTTEEKMLEKEAQIIAKEKEKNTTELKTIAKNINKVSVNTKNSLKTANANESDLNAENKDNISCSANINTDIKVVKKEPISNKKVPTIPKYSIIHRSELDLQNFTESRDSKPSTRPQQLVIEIDLPLLNCSASVGLDIFEKRLSLESVKPASYKLDIALPYPVDEKLGTARFDKAKHQLTVTLPVIPAKIEKLPECSDDDNDVSDNECDERSKNYNHDAKFNDLDSEKDKIEIDYSKNSNINNTGDEIILQSIEKSEKDVVTKSLDKAFVDTQEIESMPPDYNIVDDTTDSWDISENNRFDDKTYILPAYRHRQDNETVSFVFLVKNVGVDSVVKMFPLKNCVRVNFKSMGTGCFPMYHSFIVQFCDEHNIAFELTQIDVSEDNVVLLIVKERKTRKHWDRCYIGNSLDNLQELLLLTEKNVTARLKELEMDATENQKMLNDRSNTPDSVEVTDISEKKLTIQIKKSKRRKNRHKDHKDNTGHSRNEENSDDPDDKDENIDDGETDPPSSANIEVICDNSRKLHGILKARSRSYSESSDDLSSHYSRDNSSASQFSESPISETEEILTDGSMKKSVSFNNYIDKTTFKTNVSVNALHAALTTKRRNARKREEKREEKLARKRNRHNSNDSMCSTSSGDDELFNDIQDVESTAVEDSNKTNVSESSFSNDLKCEEGKGPNVRNRHSSGSGNESEGNNALHKSNKKKKSKSKNKKVSELHSMETKQKNNLQKNNNTLATEEDNGNCQSTINRRARKDSASDSENDFRCRKDKQGKKNRSSSKTISKECSVPNKQKHQQNPDVIKNCSEDYNANDTRFITENINELKITGNVSKNDVHKNDVHFLSEKQNLQTTEDINVAEADSKNIDMSKLAQEEDASDYHCGDKQLGVVESQITENNVIEENEKNHVSEDLIQMNPNIFEDLSVRPSITVLDSDDDQTKNAEIMESASKDAFNNFPCKSVSGTPLISSSASFVDPSISAETCLSWADKPPCFQKEDHATKCAFEFANSVIYQLDED